MSVKNTIKIGALVFPREEKCGAYVTMRPSPWTIMHSPIRKKHLKREFIYTGAINVCVEPLTHRPEHLSESMTLDTPGLVVDRLEGRCVMLKIVTVSELKSPVLGWVLESDVKVSD